MKKLFFLLIPAMMLFACNNADKKTDDKCCDEKKCEQSSCKDMMTVDSILANLEANVDKEVTVCGKCTHVCEHSGKNIFLTNPENEDILIIGKAGEGIEEFDKDLNGKHIYLKGILRSVEVEGDDEAEVHHDITVEYYIEVSEVKECCCGDKKDSKCCGDKKDSKCCGDKKDSKGCGDKKEGERKCKDHE
jgi:hypothetical protein